MTTTGAADAVGARTTPAIATRWAALILLAEVALSGVLGSIRLGHKSLWYDEAFTAMAGADGLSGAVDVARHVDSNMPLYIAGVAVWRVFGDGDAALRSLSVVAAMLSVVVVYLLAARLHGRVTGLVAGFLMAIAPLGVRYSQELRSYSMTVLLVVLSTYLFVRVVETPSAGWVALYSIVTALAFCSHLVVAFAVAGQLVSLCFLGRGRIPWRHLLVGLAAVVVLLVPLGLAVMSAADNQGGASAPSLGYIARALGRLGGGWALAVIVVAFALVAVVAAVRALRAEGRSDHVWRLALAPMVAVVGFAGVFAQAIVLQQNWSERYVLFVLPFVLITASVGLLRIGDRRVVAGALVLVAVLAGFKIANWYRQPQDDWRAVVAAIAAKAEPGDAIVMCRNLYRVPVERYMLDQPEPARPQPLSPVGDWQPGIHITDATPKASWDDYDRIWVMPWYTPTGPCTDLDWLDGRTKAADFAVGDITVERYDR